MHSDVKNCAQPLIPLLLSEIPGHHFGTNFSHPQQHQRTVSRFMFTSSAIILTVNLRSDRISSLTPAVLPPVHFAYGRPLRCSSSGRVQPEKGLCSWRCIISKGLLKISICYGGIVTEINAQKKNKKMAYLCAMFRASIFMTRFTNTSWHVKYLLHTEALHSHTNASGSGERTKVKGCPY